MWICVERCPSVRHCTLACILWPRWKREVVRVGDARSVSSYPLWKSLKISHVSLAIGLHWPCHLPMHMSVCTWDLLCKSIPWTIFSSVVQISIFQPVHAFKWQIRKLLCGNGPMIFFQEVHRTGTHNSNWGWHNVWPMTKGPFHGNERPSSCIIST